MLLVTIILKTLNIILKINYCKKVCLKIKELTIVDKKIQMLVGPIELPRRVTNAMAHDVYSHRGEYYKEVQYNVMTGMKSIFKTKQDILVYTASGTGAIEATIMHLFKPGDEAVLVALAEIKAQK